MPATRKTLKQFSVGAVYNRLEYGRELPVDPHVSLGASMEWTKGGDPAWLDMSIAEARLLAERLLEAARYAERAATARAAQAQTHNGSR